MEDLIACGARALTCLGLTVAVKWDVDVGDIVIVSREIRSEGTSYHYYLPPREEARTSQELLRSVVDACEELKAKHVVGPVFPTKVPYMVTAEAVERLREIGAAGIDMETTAVFSVGGVPRR